MRGAIRLLPQYSFLVWCSIKAQGQLYLYFYIPVYLQLSEGITIEVLSLSSYVILEIFLELFLWNRFQCRRLIFWMSSVSLNLGPCKADFIFGSQIMGTGWVFRLSNWFLGQKLLDRERLVSWSTVIVEKPNVGPKFRPYSTHSFM